MSRCPCGNAQFEQCCGPRLSGLQPAETAEALMRSRYTAFTRGDVAYLKATHFTAQPDSSWEGTEAWTNSVLWLSLEILSKHHGEPNDETGEVEFVARYLEGAQVHALHERSTFKKREGRWLYGSGTPEVTITAIARNEPCPCGSGRKWKQCHFAS